MIENEEDGDEEQIFFHKDFEKKFFSEKTNIFFVKHLLKMHYMIQLLVRLVKRIIFSVSQKHACKNNTNT